MDRREIQDRARFLYGDEIQYALAREEGKVDTDVLREKAAIRLTREMSEGDTYALVRATIDSVSRNVERQYVVDLSDGQLQMDGAIRVGSNTICATRFAREEDWVAFDQLRELKFREHAIKRQAERDFIHNEIIPRLRAHGGDATTSEACADLAAKEAA